LFFLLSATNFLLSATNFILSATNFVISAKKLREIDYIYIIYEL